MSDSNSTRKAAAPDASYNIGNITGVLSILNTAFSVPQQPVTPLPPPLILAGASLRPGMSAQAVAGRIISRQSQAGRQVGNIFADGPNVEEAMELIRIEEILNTILTESVITVVIPPGVAVTTLGIGNLGAPVLSQGATSSMAIGNGIIQ